MLMTSLDLFSEVVRSAAAESLVSEELVLMGPAVVGVGAWVD